MNVNVKLLLDKKHRNTLKTEINHSHCISSIAIVDVVSAVVVAAVFCFVVVNSITHSREISPK